MNVETSDPRAARRGASWRGRVLLLLATFTLFASIDLVVGALPVHLAASGAGEEALGILSGLFAAGTVAARPLLAVVASRRGLWAALALSAASAFVVPVLYAVSPLLAAVAAVRLLQAVVPAGLTMCAPLLLAELTPPHQRGRILGLYGVAGGLSLLIAPALGVFAVRSGGLGWVAAISACGGLIAAASVLAVRQEPTGSAGFARIAGSAGLAGSAGSAGAVPTRAPQAAQGGLAASFWLLLLLNLLSTYSFGTALAFATLHGIQLGIPNPGVFFTAYAIGMMLARYGAGIVADRRGTRRSVPLALLVLTAGLVTVALARGITAFTAGAALVGCGFGAAQTLYWSEFVGRQGSGRAVASAWFTNAFDIGIMIGSFAGGWIAALGGFGLTYGIAALIAAAGLPLWAIYVRQAHGARQRQGI